MEKVLLLIVRTFGRRDAHRYVRAPGALAGKLLSRPEELSPEGRIPEDIGISHSDLVTLGDRHR
jgi:hypothetical protein